MWLEVVFLLLGASIVGVNCHFDPETCLKTVKQMKEGLQAAKLKAHLMSQPLAFHTPDCGKQGFIDLPEFPFGKTRGVGFLFGWVFVCLLVLLYVPFYLQILVKLKHNKSKSCLSLFIEGLQCNAGLKVNHMEYFSSILALDWQWSCDQNS